MYLCKYIIQIYTQCIHIIYIYVCMIGMVLSRYAPLNTLLGACCMHKILSYISHSQVCIQEHTSPNSIWYPHNIWSTNVGITLNSLLRRLQEPGFVVEPRDLSSSLNAIDAASTVGYSQGEVESAETGTSFTAPESVVMATPKESVYDQVLAEIKCNLLQIWLLQSKLYVLFCICSLLFIFLYLKPQYGNPFNFSWHVGF